MGGTAYYVLASHVDLCLINKRPSVKFTYPPPPQYNVEVYTFLPGCEVGINKRPLAKTWPRKSTGSTLYWGKGAQQHNSYNFRMGVYLANAGISSFSFHAS